MVLQVVISHFFCKIGKDGLIVFQKLATSDILKNKNFQRDITFEPAKLAIPPTT